MEIKSSNIFWDSINDKYPDQISLLYSIKKKFDRSLVRKPKETLRLLDAGCGVGYDMTYFSRYFDVVGLDFSMGMCCRASRNLANFGVSNVLVKKGDLRNIPFEDESFDVVVSFSVIDHLPNYKEREKVVQELFRVAKHGAQVIVTVPNTLSIINHIIINGKMQDQLRAIPCTWCGKQKNGENIQEYVEINDKARDDKKRNILEYPWEENFGKNDFSDLISQVGLIVNEIKTGVFLDPHVVFNDKELEEVLNIEKDVDDFQRRSILSVLVSSLELENHIRKQIVEWMAFPQNLVMS